jgi:hypothetical protein
MTDTRTLITTTGGTPNAELAAALDALRDCERASTACAMAMVETGGMVTEIRRALDCADQCAATERILSRSIAPDSAVIAAVVQAAVVAVEASGQACGAHAEHHPHCRLHARTAGECATALYALQQTIA